MEWVAVQVDSVKTGFMFKMKFKTLKIHNFITLRYPKGFLNKITVSEISALEFCFLVHFEAISL